MRKEKQYAERNPMELDKQGNHYCRHIEAMTAEGLHDKSDIAAELGFRDARISELEAEIKSKDEALQFYARLNDDMGYDEIEEDHGRKAAEALRETEEVE